MVFFFSFSVLKKNMYFASFRIDQISDYPIEIAPNILVELVLHTKSMTNYPF